MFDQVCFGQYGKFQAGIGGFIGTNELLCEQVMGLRKIHCPIAC
jgi:hypothetical protein